MRSGQHLVALALASAMAASGGCKKNEEAPAPAGSGSAAATVSATPSAKASTSAIPSATAAAPAAPKRPTPAEAEKILEKVVADFGADKPDCVKLYAAWLEALSGITDFAAVPATKNASYVAARCAEKTNNPRALMQAGLVLAHVDPSSQKHAFVPRALIEMGKDKEAAQALGEINKTLPKEPEVMFTAMGLMAKYHDWKHLLEGATETQQAIAAAKNKDLAPLVWRTEYYREMGHLSTGDLAAAEKDITAAEKEGAPASVVNELRKELVPMKSTKMGIDVTAPHGVYLGTYHLYGRVAEIGSLANVAVMNFTGADQVAKIEMEIPGITDKLTKSVTLMKGKREDVLMTPPLKVDFKPSQLTAERTATINTKVTLGDGKTIYDESYAVTIYPRDQLPMATQSPLVAGAWVTPQSPIVEEFMTAAKKRAGGKLEGNLGPTVPQVNALYDELKARGMSYVLVTDFGAGAAQHVRLPAESIKSTNALCIDGAVLFATLMEKLGLKPFIVLVPGHAFVGWHAEPADKQPPGTDFFVETTWVADHTFDEASKIAAVEFKKYSASKTATVLDIAEMRKIGVTPQPYD